MGRLSVSIALIFLTIGISSCTSVSVNGAEDPEDQMKTLSREIAAMTKNRACKQDAECRSAALGAKSCGGPKKYVVYSVNNVNETDLMVKASSYNTLDRQVNGGSGSVGTCDVLLPPKLVCQKMVCVQVVTKGNASRPQ